LKKKDKGLRLEDLHVNDVVDKNQVTFEEYQKQLDEKKKNHFKICFRSFSRSFFTY